MAILTAATSLTAGNYYVWHDWNVTTSTTASTDIYAGWITTGTASSIIVRNNQIMNTQVYETWTDEITQQTINEQILQQQNNRSNSLSDPLDMSYENYYKRREEAERRATVLLSETLNTAQRKDFEEFGFFFVNGPSGSLYRIRKGRAINIDLMAGQSRTIVQMRLCAHPAVNCPNPDTMLAQKVYLENHEQEFLRIANKYDPNTRH